MGPDGFRTRSRGSRSDDPVSPLIPLVPILLHYGVDLDGNRWGNTAVLCPVHSERRPSMTVNVDKGVFFCFSCDAKGTALNLIMAMEGCSRGDALDRASKILAASGHEVPKRATRGRYQRPGESADTAPAGRRYVPPGRRSA
ncbi:CHC2 zinc finger domain-containing protein [Streptomyces sp. NPDC087420]|uniref:CHC2 zinc finger domain-containing protein n=1 Tax=Streptomyces sp. NPDC087420 TaxID=3365785 RepID=UPI003835DECE